MHQHLWGAVPEKGGPSGAGAAATEEDLAAIALPVGRAAVHCVGGRVGGVKGRRIDHLHGRQSHFWPSRPSRSHASKSCLTLIRRARLLA